MKTFNEFLEARSLQMIDPHEDVAGSVCHIKDPDTGQPIEVTVIKYDPQWRQYTVKLPNGKQTNIRQDMII